MSQIKSQTETSHADSDYDGDTDDRSREISSTKDDDEDFDRSKRFVETEENPEVFKSKSLNNLKPFYNGLTLDSRMAEIRKSIYYIRQNWELFETFLAMAKDTILQDGNFEFQDPKTRKHAEILFASKRDWLTKDADEETQPGYEAIKLYTSKEGHTRIYSVCNNIFRQEDSLVSVHDIRSVVFLIELMNIDLYNYCLFHPEKRNFRGIVYRGMCLTEEDFEAFRELVHVPVEKRNICIPLGLLSASSSLSVAKRFIRHQMKRRQSDRTLKPLVIKIQVIELKREYVDFYNMTFPSTELTTICAVDIHKLSRHQGEKEVLLRGPFMQVLQFYEDNLDFPGQTWGTLEAVMLNANRDHISTSQLGDLDSSAREMFAAMVAVTRCEFAIEFCKKKGLIDDAEKYKAVLGESKAKLHTLMKT